MATLALAPTPPTGRVLGEPVFRVRSLTKTYGTGAARVQALRSVDLDLFRGELLVLLGASGSGKSTLLNILGGLDVPTSGTVSFLDHELTAASEKELTRYRREHVRFVFQFYNLIPSLTARENVALGTDIAERPLPADEALPMLGLGERLDAFPAQLSGGEQQRIAIGTSQRDAREREGAVLVRALDRKLLRDLRRHRGQVLSIGAVMAAA